MRSFEKGQKLLGAFALLGAAVLLQGCVAAAVPVLAGGALARDRIGGKKNEAVEVSAPAPAETPAPALVSVQADTTPAPDSMSDNEPAAEVIASDEVGNADLVESPVVAADPAASASDRVLLPLASAGGYAPFLDYAFAKAMTPTVDAEGMTSALLRNPAALDGERLSCGSDTPAVLIDLDPAGSTFDPSGEFAAAPQLANMLANLRTRGVAIAWTSALSAADAGAVRKALARSGLDPQGEDSLLLLRYGDDRKQSRRNEFAEDHCIIAIAGDARSDFDELYEYLKEPSLAEELEAMYGAGWFITPMALTQE